MAKKNKIVFQQKYRKGITYIDHDELIRHLQEKSTSVNIISAGRFEDDSEFVTVTINLSPEYLKTII